MKTMKATKQLKFSCVNKNILKKERKKNKFINLYNFISEFVKNARY